MPLITLKPTITAGQSLSASIDCTNGTLLTIMMPFNWTNATISFQVSADNVVYYDVVDEFGKEAIWTAVAGPCLPIGSTDSWQGGVSSWKGMYMKIRYGSKDRPVNQANTVECIIAIQS